MTTGNRQEYQAAIDLGSNSFRLLIAPAGDPGAAAVKKTVTVGLGRGHGGLIQPEAMARGIEVAAGFAREIARRGIPADRIRACGTEALRRAANRGEFLRRVENTLGCGAELISGEEEARLTLAGIRAGMRTPPGEMMVADIGGRSTEFIHCRGQEVLWTASIPLGAIRTSAMLEEGEERSTAAVSRALAPLGSRKGAADLVLCGGSATTCAAIGLGLDPYDPAVVQGHRLRLSEVCGLLSRLLAMPREEMARIRGLPPDRAPLIAGGLLIIREIMRAGAFPAATVSDYGLLEGIFLSIPAS